MAIDAAGLAAALGITVAENPPDDDPGLVEAGRLLSIAGELVDAYRRDPNDELECPAAVRDEAIIRTAGHVQNRAGFGKADGRLKVSTSIQIEIRTARSAVRQSGAGALLAPWVRRTA